MSQDNHSSTLGFTFISIGVLAVFIILLLATKGKSDSHGLNDLTDGVTVVVSDMGDGINNATTNTVNAVEGFTNRLGKKINSTGEAISRRTQESVADAKQVLSGENTAEEIEVFINFETPDGYKLGKPVTVKVPRNYDGGPIDATAIIEVPKRQPRKRYNDTYSNDRYNYRQNRMQNNTNDYRYNDDYDYNDNQGFEREDMRYVQPNNNDYRYQYNNRSDRSRERIERLERRY